MKRCTILGQKFMIDTITKLIISHLLTSSLTRMDCLHTNILNSNIQFLCWVFHSMTSKQQFSIMIKSNRYWHGELISNSRTSDPQLPVILNYSSTCGHMKGNPSTQRRSPWLLYCVVFHWSLFRLPLHCEVFSILLFVNKINKGTGKATLIKW